MIILLIQLPVFKPLQLNHTIAATLGNNHHVTPPSTALLTHKVTPDVPRIPLPSYLQSKGDAVSSNIMPTHNYGKNYEYQNYQHLLIRFLSNGSPQH